MPHRAQMPIHTPDQGVATVPHLLAEGVGRDRRPTVERLQARGTVSVPEDVGVNLSSRFDSRGFTVEQVNNAYQLVVGDPVSEDLPHISKERRRILDALNPATGWTEWLAAYGGKKDTFSSGVRWLRKHEYVRQDEERGTWSPNQFTVEQAQAA